MSLDHIYCNNHGHFLNENEDFSKQKMQFIPSSAFQKHFTPYENSKWLLKTIKTLCKYCNSPSKYKEIKEELKKRGLIQTQKNNENFHNSNQENNCLLINKENSQSFQINKNEFPFPQMYNVLEHVSNSELSSVMKIQNLIDKQIYALKVIKLIYKDIPNAMHEVQCLAHLKSPRLLRYFSSWVETNPDSEFLTFYIQTEYYEGITLQNFIQNRLLDQKSYEKVLHKILYELAKALCEICQAGIVHRDLQPSNIIMKSDFSIVVIGFSISSPIRKVKHIRSLTPTTSDINSSPIDVNLHENKSLSINVSPLDALCINAAETATNFQMRKLGSPIYASPQQLNGRKSCPSDDIYSFGIIMFELLANIEGNRKRIDVIRQLRNSAVLPEKFLEQYPKEAELILRMASHDQSKRPSAQDVIQTDLFKKWEGEMDF